MQWYHIDKSTYNQRKGLIFVFRNVIYTENQTWFSRDFHFSNLTTTDTAPKSSNLKRIARYTGTIRLVVYDMTTPVPEALSQQWKPLEKVVIPEKALKGQPIDMATDFGAAKPTTERTITTDQTRVGSGLVECVFKYRSRRALQILDLIPATPEPLPLHERDPTTLNLAEARELLAQIRRQQTTTIVKQEHAGVKQEQTSQATLKPSRTSRRKRKATSATQDSDGSDDDLIFVEAKKVKNIPVDQVEVLDLS